MKIKTMILLIVLLLGLSFSGHAAEQPVHGLFLVQDRTEPLPGAPYTAEQFEKVGIKIVESVDELLSALNAEISWIAVDWILIGSGDWYVGLAHSGRYMVEFVVHEKPYFWRWSQLVNGAIDVETGPLQDSNGEWIGFDELIRKTLYRESYSKWKEILRPRSQTKAVQNKERREDSSYFTASPNEEEPEYPISQQWDYLVFASLQQLGKFNDQVLSNWATMDQQELMQEVRELTEDYCASLEKRLKELGKQGWELAFADGGVLIFKRPIPVEVKK